MKRFTEPRRRIWNNVALGRPQHIRGAVGYSIPVCSRRAAAFAGIFCGRLTAAWVRYGFMLSGCVLELPGVVCSSFAGFVWGSLVPLPPWKMREISVVLREILAVDGDVLNQTEMKINLKLVIWALKSEVRSIGERHPRRKQVIHYE
jgi:hypothetical protein